MAKRKRRAGGKRLTGRRAVTALVTLLLLIVTGYFSDTLMPAREAVAFGEGELCQVVVLDVGQGSATLVRTEDYSVLIDGGERETDRELVRDLQAAGVTRLDYVVASHLHADHIGGLPEVFGSFEVGEVLLGDLPDALWPTTSIADEFLALAEQTGADLLPVGGTQTYPLGGDVVMTVCNPVGDGTQNLNNSSLVVRVDAGAVAFLVMGDAEREVEERLVRERFPLSADLLVVGHHGSSTSTSIDFANAVRPSASAISVGGDNSYGHPHELVVNRLSAFGTIYRTDLHGTLTFSTDGSVLYVRTATAAGEDIPTGRNAA